jgi:hypothetical protein
VRALKLLEFDLEKAIASLDEGKSVIPVWLDVIYQGLVLKSGKNYIWLITINFPGAN